MKETWKWIPGYEGRYQVSDQGRVMSFMRNTTRVLRPGKMNRFGHMSVSLGRHNSKCVHYLVLWAFVGPRPEGADVCHKNGKGDDNRLTNLRYASRSENNRDMVRHGKRKLTVAQVRSLRSERESGVSIKALSDKYGVCPNNVRYVAERVYYAHID